MTALRQIGRRKNLPLIGSTTGEWAWGYDVRAGQGPPLCATPAGPIASTGETVGLSGRSHGHEHSRPYAGLRWIRSLAATILVFSLARGKAGNASSRQKSRLPRLPILPRLRQEAPHAEDQESGPALLAGVPQTRLSQTSRTPRATRVRRMGAADRVLDHTLVRRFASALFESFTNC